MRGRGKVPTESDYWMEVARAYGTPYEKRNSTQRFIAGSGLCYAKARAGGQLFPAYSVHTPRCGPGGWYYMGTRDLSCRALESDHVRCLLACLLAAMTDDEREALGVQS